MATATEIQDRGIGAESDLWIANGTYQGVRFYSVDSVDPEEVATAMAAAVSVGDGWDGSSYASVLMHGWKPIRKEGGNTAGSVAGRTIVRVDYAVTGQGGAGGMDATASAGDAFHEIVESMNSVQAYADTSDNPIEPTSIEAPEEELVVIAYRSNLNHRAHWGSIRGKTNSASITIPNLFNFTGGSFTAAQGELLARTKRETVIRSNLIRVDYRFGYKPGGDWVRRYTQFNKNGTGTVKEKTVYDETAFITSTLWG